MNTQNINEKTKILLRATGGSCIHFIGTVLWSLVTDKDINLVKKNKALYESAEINRYHNFSKFWDNNINQQQFIKYTGQNINLEESIEWAKNSIEFYESDYDYYIFFGHSINPDPLMLAFNNTKLINITYTEHDFDQLAYNWVIKTGREQSSILQKYVKKMQTTFNKLNEVPIESVNNSYDFKLLTYLRKFAIIEHTQEMMNFVLSDLYPRFDIKFSDIMSGAIDIHLDDLINFVGIEVSQERKSKVIKLINEYAVAQTPVPWNLDINDYN